MSNSEEEKRIERISEILEATREGVDELCARVPNLMHLNSIDEISSEEDREFFYESMFSVFLEYEIGVNVPGQFPTMIPAEYREIFDWHEKEFPPILNKVQELAMGKIVPGIQQMRAKIESNPPRDRVEAAIADILNSAPLLEIFKWEKNERAHPPIATERDIGEIPAHLRKRMDETHRSFVFGNWTAAIALSRSLLEQAIVGRRAELGIDEGVHGLCKLIKAVRKTNSELAARMDEIRLAGNQAMHSQSLQGENDAEKCFADIREIIRELYGK